MTGIFKAAMVAFALGGGSVVAGAAGAPAMAADVTVAVPGIAFGYNDGYWDRERNFHEWRDRQEADRFRAENRDHYYERKHDEEKDHGWRESDRYWDRH